MDGCASCFKSSHNIITFVSTFHPCFHITQRAKEGAMTLKKAPFSTCLSTATGLVSGML